MICVDCGEHGIILGYNLYPNMEPGMFSMDVGDRRFRGNDLHLGYVPELYLVIYLILLRIVE